MAGSSLPLRGQVEPNVWPPSYDRDAAGARPKLSFLWRLSAALRRPRPPAQPCGAIRAWRAVATSAGDSPGSGVLSDLGWHPDPRFALEPSRDREPLGAQEFGVEQL